MKLAPLLSTALAVAVAAGAASAAAITPQDRTFVTAAAMDGMTAVSDASLALMRTKTPAVTGYAKAIQADYSKTDAQLATLARAGDVELPSGIGPVNTKMKGSLESLHGLTFDAAYFQGQKVANAASIAVYKQEIAKGSEPGLVAFAKQTLPKLQQHGEMISKGLLAMRGMTGESMNAKNGK